MSTPSDVGQTESADSSSDHDAPDDGAEKTGLPARFVEPEVPPPLPRYSSVPREVNEALRGIVNRYELRTGAALPHSIAVTSALAGEGVTTISQSLATLIAHELGRLTCWVDFSWLAGGDDNSADPDRPSLADLLANGSSIANAFQAQPGLPELIVLQPGPVPERERTAILRSPEFGRLLSLLIDEFDHIVFDTPPVLSHNNALTLLRLADTSLFVVKHRSTSITQLRRAVESTQPTPTLGAVLNGYQSKIPTRLQLLLGG